MVGDFEHSLPSRMAWDADSGTTITLCRQWRNSYGLRVGKPAATRAEGAPAGCPFTLVFQLRLPFQKGAPFQHFFSYFGCEILITMYFINWWNQNYLGAPTTRAEGPGRNFTCVRYTGMYRPNGWILHKKSVNMGPILTPPKKKKSRNMDQICKKSGAIMS